MRLPRRRRARARSTPASIAARFCRSARPSPGPAIVLQKDYHDRHSAGLSRDQRRRRQSDSPIAGIGDARLCDGSNAPAAALDTRVDPITAAVIQGALENIAIEMGHKLMRMSYSCIIREFGGFRRGADRCRGRGNSCECKMSTPLQSGPIPGYVRGILKTLAARGDVFRPGDVIMHNDPYGGASHGPDVAFCVPVFDGDELLGFSRHDRASSRHRRAHAGKLRHRRRGRRLCRRPAVQGDQGRRPGPAQRCGLANRARQHPHLRSGRRRHGGADRRRADRRAALPRSGATAMAATPCAALAKT